MPTDDIAEYDLLYVTHTQRALGVCRSVDDDDVIWLPRSQISYDDKEYERKSEIDVSIPTWLAKKHDLV
jgi:hypothetical protein